MALNLRKWRQKIAKVNMLIFKKIFDRLGEILFSFDHNFLNGMSFFNIEKFT